MQSIDASFHWSDPEWWADEAQAKIIAVVGGHGFAIVGYGKNVDADVASEICELYCKNPWALLPLIRSCLPHIRWPFGFQVLATNVPAQIAFERMLPLLKLKYIKTRAMDGASVVYKYRITAEQGVQPDAFGAG